MAIKKQNLWDKLTFSQRSGLFVALVVLICGFLMSAFTYIQSYRQLLEQQQLDHQQQLKNMASFIFPNMTQADRISLNLIINDWIQVSGTLGIRLLDENNQVLALNGTVEGEKQTLELNQDGKKLGTLESYVSNTPAQQKAQHNAALAFLVGTLLSFISGLVTWQLTERHRQYISSLTKKLHQWQKTGSLELPLRPVGLELKDLHYVLSHIEKDELRKKAVQDALSQFMGDNQYKLPAPMKYYNCALLFIEIQDLELLQSRLSAEELSNTLGEYHRLLSRSAKLYNGTVDRYLGDGIVMLFGIPNNDQNAAIHCLYAARLFTGLVNHLRESKSSLLPLEFNIAAHWGPVLMAPIQDSVSTQYSLIGDTIHWAYHLANHSEERRVLVSQTIIEKIDKDNGIHWKNGPEIKDLHGHSQKSFWMTSLPEKNESLIQRQIQHITSMTESA